MDGAGSSEAEKENGGWDRGCTRGGTGERGVSLTQS